MKEQQKRNSYLEQWNLFSSTSCQARVCNYHYKTWWRVRPFRNSLQALFLGECEVFVMNISFDIHIAIRNNYQDKNFALWLALRHDWGTLKMIYSNHTNPLRHCPILCPRVTLLFLESRKKTGGFDYLNMLMDTSKPGLQSSKPDKALNTIGRTKFRMVMVSEGAKLSNVCKNELIFAAACWNVWMKRKKNNSTCSF